MAQEAEFRLYNCLKGKALGRLDGLDVFKFERTMHKGAFVALQKHGIPEALVGMWTCGRKVLVKELEGKPRTAEALKAALSRRYEAIVEIDASWEVDNAFS